MPASALPVADALPFDSAYFRQALSQFVTGVTVVTTRDAAGGVHGLTVNSFNAVSLAPPLVLWSLDRRARCLPAFQAATHYLVHVLAADQQALALRFARGPAAQRFGGLALAWSARGLPRLAGVAAVFECRNRSRYPEGDHVIFVGEVEHCEYQPIRPLGFHGGQFLVL